MATKGTKPRSLGSFGQVCIPQSGVRCLIQLNDCAATQAWTGSVAELRRVLRSCTGYPTKLSSEPPHLCGLAHCNKTQPSKSAFMRRAIIEHCPIKKKLRNYHRNPITEPVRACRGGAIIERSPVTPPAPQSATSQRVPRERGFVPLVAVHGRIPWRAFGYFCRATKVATPLGVYNADGQKNLK
jgi:hypothetical protein